MTISTLDHKTDAEDRPLPVVGLVVCHDTFLHSSLTGTTINTGNEVYLPLADMSLVSCSSCGKSGDAPYREKEEKSANPPIDGCGGGRPGSTFDLVGSKKLVLAKLENDF